MSDLSDAEIEQLRQLAASDDAFANVVQTYLDKLQSEGEL